MPEKLVVIRDDDINCFTKISTLNSIYSKEFFRKGFKVSFSVIPFTDTSIEIHGQKNPFARKGYKYEPFIPHGKIRTGTYPLDRNHRLVKWLKSRKNAEICMHGYSHSKDDFTSNDENAIREMLSEGRAILSRLFGREIKTFVPPHEALSKAAWKILAEEDFYIFRNIIRPVKDVFFTVPVAEYGLDHLKKEFLFGFNGVVKYRHGYEIGCMNPYLFSCFWDMEVAYNSACRLFEKSDIFVVSNHHWEFDINVNMLHWWRKFVDYMSGFDVVSLTASEAVRGYEK